MLNPDGVARGYWRTDTNGIDLNRRWNSFDETKYPTVVAAKNAILKEFANENLKMFVDLHAHQSKRGCFMFWNSFDDID